MQVDVSQVENKTLGDSIEHAWRAVVKVSTSPTESSVLKVISFPEAAAGELV